MDGGALLLHPFGNWKTTGPQLRLAGTWPWPLLCSRPWALRRDVSMRSWDDDTYCRGLAENCQVEHVQTLLSGHMDWNLRLQV